MKSVVNIIPPYKCIHKHVSTSSIQNLKDIQLINNFTSRPVIILISSAATDERVSRENEENGKHW